MPITTETSNQNLHGVLDGASAPHPPPPYGLSEIVVQFAPDTGSDTRAAAAQAVGGYVIEDIHTQAMKDAGQGVLSRMAVADALTFERVTELLSATADVLHASPSGQGGIEGAEGYATTTPYGVPSYSNDEYYVSGQLWGMYGDATSPSNPYGSQAGEAWAAGYTGSPKVAIGVIDSGIDPTNPDLYLNIWLHDQEIPKDLGVLDTDADGLITFKDLNDQHNADLVSDSNDNGYIDARDLLVDPRWADGVDNDGNGYVDDLYGWDFANNDNDPYDDSDHGTHVAGTIGAIGGNEWGVAGVAWSVQLIALKWLQGSGTGGLIHAAQAIDYYTAIASHDPTLDYVATNNSWYEFGTTGNQPVRDAINRAADVGVLFVTIAGNGANNNDVVPTYPGNYDSSYDGGWDNVVATAAIDQTGNLWSGSSYGQTSVDLGAPGVNIASTNPVTSVYYMTGTSMAAAHVSGTVALYAVYDGNASAADIQAALLANVDPTASLDGKVATGGRLDVSDLMASLPPSETPPGQVDCTDTTPVVEKHRHEFGHWVPDKHLDSTTPAVTLPQPEQVDWTCIAPSVERHWQEVRHWMPHDQLI